jgi:Chromo (CHRromatin Organisation MOdifier) domain
MVVIPVRVRPEAHLFTTRNLKINHHKKIAPKQDEVLGPVTYQLKLPESWRIHNVFHAALLRPYIENEVYGNNYPRPLPELLEGEEVYEVETILKHQRRGRGYQYYVKWKGYPITEATWEENIRKQHVYLNTLS